MFSKRGRVLVAVCLVSLLAGCASDRPSMAGGPSVEDIYNQVNRRGARDTVRLVRQGLMSRGSAGTSDPTIPIRDPERIAPIWVPPYVDKQTGRRVDGHWQHSVIENSKWQLEY